ncbi:MAG: FAD-binding oxidoreductase, partial [Actinomycetota bacterium]
GFDDEVPGFFWLAGQGGTGIQTAPAAGRLAGALITDGAVPDDLVALGFGADAVAPSRSDLRREPAEGTSPTAH